MSNPAARWLVVAATVLLVAAGTARGEDPGERSTVDGTLTIVWGDSAPGSGGGARTVARLIDDEGRRFQLDAGQDGGGLPGGLVALDGRRVRVWVDPERMPATGDDVLPLAAVSALEPEADRSVTGSQPWVSLLCRFPNVASTPKPLSYFGNMFDNSSGRLDHYWREVSYGTIDIVGSTAFAWRALPHPQSSYMPTPGDGCLDSDPTNDADLDALFSDCVAAFDSLVDFSNGGNPFVGINLMFNSDLDGCAWGGTQWATLDGISGLWRVTWEPPWGFNDVCVMAHEMGHGFGLPHSNNWDDDGWPYDNTWDVMSDSWNYAGWDPTYGTVGKHTIAYHKDLLGWIAPERRFEAPPDSFSTLTLDDLAQPSSSNYRMAVIPLDGNRHYTVEARRRTGLYDGSLPGDAVIIHHVDPSRSQPAWAYDNAVPPGNTSAGEGVMWRVGETFADAANQVAVTVEAATATGFVISIQRGDAQVVFHTGFEGGTTGDWSDLSP